jgi:hypothetical protein
MNCCIESMDLHLVQNLLHWGERGKWRWRRGGGGRSNILYTASTTVKNMYKCCPLNKNKFTLCCCGGCCRCC